MNARRIAKELNSSVHPIFRHFTDMEELKKAVYKKIYAKYQEYMQIEINENKAYKKMGISYIKFAKNTLNFLRLFLCKKQI